VSQKSDAVKRQNSNLAPDRSHRLTSLMVGKTLRSSAYGGHAEPGHVCCIVAETEEINSFRVFQQCLCLCKFLVPARDVFVNDLYPISSCVQGVR